MLLDNLGGIEINGVIWKFEYHLVLFNRIFHTRLQVENKRKCNTNPNPEQAQNLCRFMSYGSPVNHRYLRSLRIR